MNSLADLLKEAMDYDDDAMGGDVVGWFDAWRQRVAAVLAITPHVEHAACRVVRDALSVWPDSFDGGEAELNGGDLVDWFSGWRERAKESLRGIPVSQDGGTADPVGFGGVERATEDDVAVITIVLQGGMVSAVISDDTARIGQRFAVIDYDTDGAESSKLERVTQDDGRVVTATIHRGRIETAGNVRILAGGDDPAEDIEAACRAAGWTHGGDRDGVIFHEPTWGSWKAAESWAGTDNEPNGLGAKPWTYATWEECYEGEDIAAIAASEQAEG